MKKNIAFLFLSIGFISLVFTEMAKADGMVISPEKYTIRENGQKAVIFHDKGIETLIISISFQGDAKDFAWVVPTPQKPEVTKGSDEIFTSLEEITHKNRNYYDGIMPMMGAARTYENASVTVLETKKIDYYDIVVLSATESGALAKWLSDNGYKYPEESAYILNDYINNGWYFVAVKISPEAAGITQVANGLETGHATPLKLVFKSDAIIYPMRISAVENDQSGFSLSNNLFLDQQRINLLKDIGYDKLADKTTGPNIFKEIIQDLVVDKEYSSSVASNYPLVISEKDYTSKFYCSGVSNCQSHVERWFNNYFSQFGVYNNYSYKNDYVPVYLYVIADGKKEVPGFYADYANWIKTKDIKKLAYDTNGNPLINPAGGKYYLTALYRNILKSEMTSDLVIRPAENNSRVNAPDPGMNILWISLIALGCIFVWTITPLGLIFIISTVIRATVQSDVIKMFARTFQIISILLTLGLFLFFAIFASRLGAISAGIWAWGGACGLGIILLGQIIIMIKTKGKNNIQ